MCACTFAHVHVCACVCAHMSCVCMCVDACRVCVCVYTGKREPQRQRGAMKVPGRLDSIRLIDDTMVTWLCTSYLTF